MCRISVAPPAGSRSNVMEAECCGLAEMMDPVSYWYYAECSSMRLSNQDRPHHTDQGLTAKEVDDTC
jgi:hypothetical protein